MKKFGLNMLREAQKAGIATYSDAKSYPIKNTNKRLVIRKRVVKFNFKGAFQ